MMKSNRTFLLFALTVSFTLVAGPAHARKDFAVIKLMQKLEKPAVPPAVIGWKNIGFGKRPQWIAISKGTGYALMKDNVTVIIETKTGDGALKYLVAVTNLNTAVFGSKWVKKNHKKYMEQWLSVAKTGKTWAKKVKGYWAEAYYNPRNRVMFYSISKKRKKKQKKKRK
jgi:hypothetical protein